MALLAFVYERTNSLAWVGAAGIVRFVPALVLSPYAGVVAERMERIRLMAGSDWLCAAWQFGLVIVAAADGPVALALLFSALTSATNVVYEPAVEAISPRSWTRTTSPRTRSTGRSYNLVVVAGPAMGAGLLCSGRRRSRSRSTPPRSSRPP